MWVIVEQLVDWRLAGETEVLGENLPQRHFGRNDADYVTGTDQWFAQQRTVHIAFQTWTSRCRFV
jgi:hypothetical protein